MLLYAGTRQVRSSRAWVQREVERMEADLKKRITSLQQRVTGGTDDSPRCLLSQVDNSSNKLHPPKMFVFNLLV